MGNRLSGLWCKKTTTLHINNDPKQQQQQTQINNDNNKSQKRKSGGTFNGSTFRLGSARRLSLTSCVSKDNNKKTTNKSANSVVSTIEKEYEELVKTPVTDTNSKQYESKTLPNLKSKTSMKVNAQLPTTAKVSSQFNDSQLQCIIEVAFWIFYFPFLRGGICIFNSSCST